jgi:hypothetical protein
MRSLKSNVIMIMKASRPRIRAAMSILFGFALAGITAACSGDLNGQGSSLIAGDMGWASDDPSTGCADGTLQKGNMSMSEQRDFLKPGIPPIDSSAPERIQTATFAMG